VRRGCWPLLAGVLALGLLGGTGCKSEKTDDPLVERAAFGVFFGGQIQDRKELAFELDQTKQRIGIRIEFRAPLARSVPVAWEIARPLAKTKHGDAAADHVVEVGDAAARVGEARLDVPLSLRQGQGLGAWHVRVKVDGRQVIDRDVLVFDPRDRREREADAGH
jgi:hypothetical protein